MRTILLVLLAWSFLTVSFGQGIDSVSAKIGRISEELHLDSIPKTLPQSPDTLSSSLQRLDSIQKEFIVAADTIQKKYQNAILQIDIKARAVNEAIDSLQTLYLPTARYTDKLDSLQHIKDNLESKYKSKFDSLKSKTIGRLVSLDLPVEYKAPLEKLSANISDVNIKTDFAKMPSLGVRGFSLPQVNELDQIAGKASQFGSIDDAVKLPDLDTPLDNLDQISGQAGTYKGDIKNITGGNLQQVQQLPETIEAQASRIDGMDELQKQTGVIDRHKAQLDELADPKNAKKKIVAVAKEKAVDHFAGKEEQLKSAMEKMSKYKQKYSSVSSIKDLPKRPLNAMKGKPFVERLIPGVYLQYQQKTYYLVDINPYVGYKLSGRITTGFGWNHRLAWDSKHERWDQRSRIFGPRTFVDFKLGKGFIAHLEGESMNSFVPSTLHGNPDAGRREWVWSCMTGMKKEYRIYKNLKGIALIQYNLFNRYYRAPYVDRFNSRIGFEYVLKKKIRK